MSVVGIVVVIVVVVDIVVDLVAVAINVAWATMSVGCGLAHWCSHAHFCVLRMGSSMVAAPWAFGVDRRPVASFPIRIPCAGIYRICMS